MIINGIVLTVLAVESVSDIKKRSLPLLRLIAYFILALAGNFIFYYQTIPSMIGGMGVGLFVLIYGFLTREGIGYGDGAVFVCLGAVLGLSKNLKLLFFSLLLAAAAGGIYAAFKKKGLRIQIPFIPCVTCTFAVMTVLEGCL